MSLAIAWIGYVLAAAIVIGVILAIIGKRSPSRHPASRSKTKDPARDETLRQMMLDDFAAHQKGHGGK
ncbi:MAG: hypothetical protein ACI361_04270 [Atopobiaceae bacterium]